MRPKLYGIGKCGSRIVFDFSAYTYSHPPAFELRNNNIQAVDQIVGVYKKIKRGLQDIWGKISRPEITPVRLYTTYSSVAIDSDLEGNEVTKLQAYIAEQRHAIRPIEKSLALGNRVGGCEFGLVSEAFAHAWLNLREKPAELSVDVDAEKLALVATSLGGGTGSGASPVLAHWLSSEYNTELRPFHVSVVGILPMSDLNYGGTLKPIWDFSDQVNTGRVIAGFLKTVAEASSKQVIPGLWILSNDLLRVGRNGSQDSSNQAVNDRSISVVNYHVATVACLLSNIGGAPEDPQMRQYVTVEANLDAAEMNNHLGGSIYFTGYSKEDSQNDFFKQDIDGKLFARSLLRRALEPLDLEYTFDKDAAPCGCSIPFRANEWNLEELNAWCRAADFHQPSHLPVELRTARWIGVVYGQPEKHRSSLRLEALKHAAGELFPAADVVMYPFYHQFDNSEHLCLFVAGGFNRVIYLALAGYCQACFAAGDNFLPELDAAFREGSFSKLNELISSLEEIETYSRQRFGAEAEELSTQPAQDVPIPATPLRGNPSRRPVPRLLTRDDVGSAFRLLLESYCRPPKSRYESTV